MAEAGEIARGVESAATGFGLPVTGVGGTSAMRSREPALAVNVGATDGEDAGHGYNPETIAPRRIGGADLWRQAGVCVHRRDIILTAKQKKNIIRFLLVFQWIG